MCMGCCLLIKWNCFFMMGGMALAAAALAVKRSKPYNILWGLAGIGVVVLPFVAYFLCMGNLADFVTEYFVNTFQITNHPDSSFYREKIILTVLFVFLAYFCRRMRLGYWLLLAYLPFYVFLVMRAMVLHYFVTTMPFFVFVLIYIAKVCSRPIVRLGTWGYAALLVAVFVAGTVFNLRTTYFTPHSDTSGERVAVMQYLARTDQVKVIFDYYDLGQGLLARALPACKYWAEQKDATRLMVQEREKAVADRRADFIIISRRSEEMPSKLVRIALKSGYRQCYGPVTENGETRIRPLPLYERR